jgi:hypothetical protein
VTDSEMTGILNAAALQDPSIGGAAAERIARTCLTIAAAHPDADAAELARRCVAQLPDADASWVAHIAPAVTRTLSTRRRPTQP